MKRFLEKHHELAVAKVALAEAKAGELAPNIADTGYELSLLTSFFMLDEMLKRSSPPVSSLEIVPSGQTLGRRLEDTLAIRLRELVTEAGYPFEVASKGDPGTQTPQFDLTAYWPYATPPAVSAGPAVNTALRQLGRGHLIQPDVVVWRTRLAKFHRVDGGRLLTEEHEVRQLFACISGKATIRSDRSQSARYEGIVVSRWGRARAPHFVVVTAEPVPSRLGSLAWGLGEIDCVYHVDLGSLVAAVEKAEDEPLRLQPPRPSDELRELIEQARVRDLSDLFDDLFDDLGL
ncbi:MAG: hypothetical protein OXI50_02110 [Gammaproteobacteria bacterium]|nr:hypothetical protein [Gammaproteobacteria bacterium]